VPLNNYMGNRGARAYFDAQYAVFRTILSEVGLPKLAQLRWR
jgi:hypothetical protein